MGVWVQTCQDHFQQERERERADPAGLRRSEMYFLGDVGPSAPFQVRNGKEEASGNINLPTGREAPNLSDCMKTRTSTVHHLLAPAAAILTVPPSLKSFKDTSGREGGEHTESRGGKGKRLAQLGNRSGVTGKAAAPLQSSGAYLGSFPSGTRREGVRFRASPGHRDEGTLGPPPQPAGGTACQPVLRRRLPHSSSSLPRAGRPRQQHKVIATHREPQPRMTAGRVPAQGEGWGGGREGCCACVWECACVRPRACAGLREWGRARAGRDSAGSAALPVGVPRSPGDLSGHAGPGREARSDNTPLRAAPRSQPWALRLARGPVACPWVRGVGARPSIGFLIRT